MLDFPLWKRLSLWLVTLLLAVLALPSIFSLSGVALPSWANQPQINLGLDLAGGSHILLEADPAQVSQQRLESMEERVRDLMDDADPRIEIGEISIQDSQLSFMLEDSGDIDRAREELREVINGTGLVREWDLQVLDGNRMVLTETEQGLDQAVENAMESATEVVRRRIDGLGTREPTIIRQGDNRIVVQVPGLDDPEQLKSLLGQTARLEFKLVSPNLQFEMTEEQARAQLLPGTEMVPFAEGTGQEGSYMVVNRLGGIRGDSLTSAQQQFSQQDNLPVVSIQFDAQGGARFATLSTQNVDRRFAIILDDEIISAPVFNEPILSGQAQISGNFTVASASELAIQLGSGALPVDLTIIEERTVGPDLGRDSIVAGAIAMAIGSLLVVLLMVASYGRFGIYATVALVFNVLMIIGIMAYFNATLTLPGIAGLVLTIGAAVDANVLINERIREERRRGRRVMAAVENGYKEASRAIWDANLTNVIAAIILAWIAGSGPVRGFAVVLIIGIATTIFTAVYLTRMWVAMWLRAKRPTEITV